MVERYAVERRATLVVANIAGGSMPVGPLNGRYRRTIRWIMTVAIAGCAAMTAAWAAASPSMLPAVGEKWRYYTSPHFELYSCNGDRDSRELLHNLETLRAVFLDRLKLEERLHVDVTIYYFGAVRDFQAYAPEALRHNSSLAGFYLFRPDRAVISMAPADDADAAQQTIFHEYVHHLFRLTEQNPPLWFNEGTADVLAGMQVERDRVLIGMPLVGRAMYLREESMIPLDELLRVDHSSPLYTQEKHTGVFYAESWALLHFWHFGQSGLPPGAADRFLRVAGDRDKAAATDLSRHFQACFGCDYREMLRRLKTYIRTGTYRAGSQPLPKVDAASSYGVRPVSRDEITVRLAELAVRVEHSPIGKLVLLNATTGRPNDARSFETLGTEAIFEGDERTAAERWEQALVAGSQNRAIVRELALMEGRQWFAKFDESFRLQLDAATRMRARLLRSIASEPDQGAAYEMLAWVEAFAERPEPKNINRVIAQLPTMADKKRTLVALARLMLRVARPEEARTMLDYLGALPLEPEDARATAVLRARLQADFPTLSRVRPPQAGETPITAPPTAPPLKTPSIALPDDL